MAERRMFAKQIVESDAFTDMPLSAQALYFHIGMAADDEGFVNNPKKLQRMLGCADDDLKLLIAKRFLLAFESGVVVVKHWKINNFIRSDRFKETIYQEEKGLIAEKVNHAYTDDVTAWLSSGIPSGNQVVYPDKTRLDKTSTEKTSIDKFSKGQTNSVRELLSEDEIKSLQQQLPPGCFEYLIGAIDTQGFSDIKKPYNYILQFAKNRGFIK